MTKRVKIFISAYACEPGLGSEIGVGWHWVLEMSKYFELWVLTRESNRQTIETWIAEHPEFGGIHFLYYDWPKWARFWKKGLRGVRTYYNIWQYCTNRIVKRTMQENGITVFHHLTYGNALWKVSSYGQRQFFIWGPIGGLETIPEEYSKHYGRRSQIIESLRRVAASLTAFNFSFKKRCARADLILAKTEITRRMIPQKYAAKAIQFTDVAADIANMNVPAVQHHEFTEFITVGRLDAWRGFDLAIEALAKASKTNKQIHLTIVGNGPDRERIERLIKKHGLDKLVTLTGKVPMNTYKLLMEQADAVINAALKEGAVTVSFDCMAMGKPLICLDTTGYTRYFTNEYAILIPQSGREEVIRNLSNAMLRLTDVSERIRLGNNARIASANFTWEHHGEEIRKVITDSLNAYRK